MTAVDPRCVFDEIYDRYSAEGSVDFSQWVTVDRVSSDRIRSLRNIQWPQSNTHKLNLGPYSTVTDRNRLEVNEIECDNYVLHYNPSIKNVKCKRVLAVDVQLVESQQLFSSGGTCIGIMQVDEKTLLESLDCECIRVQLLTYRDPEDAIKMVKEWGSKIPHFNCKKVVFAVPAVLVNENDKHERWYHYYDGDLLDIPALIEDEDDLEFEAIDL